MAEDHKALFRRYIGIWTTGNVDALEDVLGPGYLGHVGSNATKDHGLALLKRRIAEYRASNPNASVTVEDQAAEGDRVFTRMTARSPKGEVAGFNVSRFEKGRIVEEWALWERLF